MVDKINAGSPSYLWNTTYNQTAENATKKLATLTSEVLKDKSPIEEDGSFYPDVSFTKAQISGELKKNATEMGKVWDETELAQTAQAILYRLGYDTDAMEPRLSQSMQGAGTALYVTFYELSPETETGVHKYMTDILSA